MAKRETYKAARMRLHKAFTDAGFNTSLSTLKVLWIDVPAIDSVTGTLRIWIKAQSAHYSMTRNFGDARSIFYDLDIRGMAPEVLQQHALRRVAMDGGNS